MSAPAWKDLDEYFDQDGHVPEPPIELSTDPIADAIVDNAPADNGLLDELHRRVESVVDYANRRAKVSGKLVVIADVVRGTVQWIWPGRLARGKLHLLAGDPGLGKSFLTLDMAMRITTGRDWPDGSPAVPAGNVLVLSAEDDAADTIRPRYESMGGDIYRLYVQQGKPLSLQTDLEELETQIRATSAVLVVVDPINSYVGKIDSYKDSDVRSVLDPLAQMAGGTGAALIAVMHLTKTSDNPTIAKAKPDIYRILGSIGYVGAARSVMMVQKGDPDGTRLLQVVKSNLGQQPVPVMAYRLEEPTPNQPVVVWEGTRTGAVKDPQFEADCQILLEIVAKGAVPAESGKAAAKAAGLKEGKRYYLAKAAVITTYRPMGVAETVWLWRRKDSLALPGEVIKPPEEQAPSRG